MEYRDILLQYFFDDNIEDMIEWMSTQPILQQMDILREMKEILNEKLRAQPAGNKNERYLNLDKMINEHQEKIINEQMAILKYELVEKERDHLYAEMNKRLTGSRAYIIECIINNAPNAAEMKRLAMKIIHLEKENGSYDENNWIGVV